MAIPLGESDHFKRRLWNEQHGVKIVNLEPNFFADMDYWLNLPPAEGAISSDGQLRCTVSGEICASDE